MSRLKRNPKPINTKQASAIFTADLHLTNVTPVSRMDDYIKAQETKLRFLNELSLENGGCPVVCSGDVFDHWKASPWLSSWAHKHLPENFITVPGNHDLPLHSFDEYDKSALHLLESVGGAIRILKSEPIRIGDINIYGIPFGLNTPDEWAILPKDKWRRNILVLHTLVWEKNRPPWAPSSDIAGDLLDKFGDNFDIILTGDNHQSFVVEGNGSILINPGSMMRSTVDQANFKPRCFLYYGETNEVVACEFPIDQGVHDDSHIIRKEQNLYGERIAAYIDRMDQMGQDWKTEMSFKKNLTLFFKENKTPKKVREIIWQHLETNQK